MNACLALNASYEPLRLISMTRAVRLVLDQKAEIVEHDSEKVVRSERITMPRPTVIRLKRFIYVPRRLRRQVSNTWLFARDDYTCQYCGRKRADLGKYNGKMEGLEREHVIPKSKGGADTWENVTTACTACNSKKANKTPKEAKMKLRSVPSEPKFVHLQWTVRKLTATQRKYVSMFFGEDVVEDLEAVLEVKH
jgi:5-methylcytosine-specific restriction endonuclease McrA